jgi:hypothetical protein
VAVQARASAAPAATWLEKVDTLRYLVALTLAQFNFETALSMLRSTSDDLLAAGVGVYACFLAIRRQESFMSSILAQRALLETHSAVEAAVGDCCFFLSAMRHADALELSTLVDLV